MFAHALDRPVCHDGDSLHPSTPSFPSVSHPPHLSSTITPSPLRLRSLFLSFARTRAGVVFLPSFSPLTTIPLSGSFRAANIPAKTICQDTGRKCKASSTLFNYCTRFNADSFASMPISMLINYNYMDLNVS